MNSWFVWLHYINEEKKWLVLTAPHLFHVPWAVLVPNAPLLFFVKLLVYSLSISPEKKNTNNYKLYKQLLIIDIGCPALLLVCKLKGCTATYRWLCAPYSSTSFYADYWASFFHLVRFSVEQHFSIFTFQNVCYKNSILNTTITLLPQTVQV